MTTDTHDIHDLALRHIVVKLALRHIERLSKDQAELVRDEFRFTIDPLMKKGFSGKVRIGNTVALVPKAFEAIFRDDAPEVLWLINMHENESIAVSRQKVLDQYTRVFL
ncbi:hypothetical protein ACX3YG_08870 [Pseudomonas wadenswilerensis]